MTENNVRITKDYCKTRGRTSGAPSETVEIPGTASNDNTDDTVAGYYKIILTLSITLNRSNYNLHRECLKSAHEFEEQEINVRTMTYLNGKPVPHKRPLEIVGHGNRLRCESVDGKGNGKCVVAVHSSGEPGRIRLFPTKPTSALDHSSIVSRCSLVKSRQPHRKCNE